MTPSNVPNSLMGQTSGAGGTGPQASPLTHTELLAAYAIRLNQLETKVAELVAKVG